MEGVKTVLNWSSGKDAALSYYLLQEEGKYHVTQLLTTINDEHDRVVMHGVREVLLDAQATAMGIPHKKIKLPASPNHDVYDNAMAQALGELKQEGITTAAFGDIFLEDLKAYREKQLATAGFDSIFPLWKKETREVITLLENTGIAAMVVCVNEKYLGKEFLGRKIDSAFLQDLPGGVDPCGENGEFHTYIYDAPYFSAPIAIQKGEIVYKHYTTAGDNTWDTGFYFLDLLPGNI